MTTPFLHSNFKSASERLLTEKVHRQSYRQRVLSFGIRFLDRAMRGILPSDLILLGAYSGSGKTQFCVNLSLANVKKGRRVHFIALEAEPNEIEMRLKYSLLAKMYFADMFRPRLKTKLNFTDWILGEFDDDLSRYEKELAHTYGDFENLFTFYKSSKFGLSELVENIYTVAQDTDLIIVDHVHYFDFDDDNENRALKEIAKTVRDVCQNIGKPILLVAHLRKRDRKASEKIAGLDEFHGSSDLVKIATKVITLAGGEVVEPGVFETFIRIPKCRMDGSVTRYCAAVNYDIHTGTYRENFMPGILVDNNTQFKAVIGNDLPYFLKGAE